ncbi:hypothetical protein D3C71_522790 [compost metagenome]
MAGLGVQVGEVAGAVFDLMMQAAQGLDGEGGDRIVGQGGRLDPGGRLQHQQGVARRGDGGQHAIIGLTPRGQQMTAQGREAGRAGLQGGGVEDVADEDVEVAGGVGLVRQPLQLGLDAFALGLGQQRFEDADGGAQAA